MTDDAQIGRLELELKATNETVWEIEDSIRAYERAGEFGGPFVELARSVYRINDRRAELKRAINTKLRSNLVEEKSYYKGIAHPVSTHQVIDLRENLGAGMQPIRAKLPLVGPHRVVQFES